RDLKDYLVAAKDGTPVNPGSPFNIKEDSAVIGNFSQDDVARLFAQRTKETGQQIEPAALDYVWEQSKGQPWIVNSLFKRATLRILQRDDFQTVTLDHIKTAREQMILARETHLDSLVYRLRDPQVKYMMEKLLTGEPDTNLVNNEGFRVCLDLGLVAIENQTPQVANPIYREVLAREISYSTQFAMPTSDQFRWQKPDGTLDMEMLLKEFQEFWRLNSEVWELQSDYTEAFPHLLVMAFLQRLTNGEGQITREYAAGRGRMDLFIDFKGTQHIIEIKLIHDYNTPENVRKKGIEQILLYRDKFNKNIPCYLLIFDRRSKDKKLTWEQRITWAVEGDVTVVGC
ncbi:MAG: PD-(D/E)XK nuclease domain-containing protein, partial [Planctomycetaceae bacterium]|nr:PD-(D/E)XK nuclease domain-containing protein [Planctomycetaceae bacterium]